MYEFIERICVLSIIDALFEQLQSESRYRSLIHLALAVQIIQLTLDMIKGIF